MKITFHRLPEALILAALTLLSSGCENSVKNWCTKFGNGLTTLKAAEGALSTIAEKPAEPGNSCATIQAALPTLEKIRQESKSRGDDLKKTAHTVCVGRKDIVLHDYLLFKSVTHTCEKEYVAYDEGAITVDMLERMSKFSGDLAVQFRTLCLEGPATKGVEPARLLRELHWLINDVDFSYRVTVAGQCQQDEIARFIAAPASTPAGPGTSDRPYSSAPDAQLVQAVALRPAGLPAGAGD